jgi:hypothetical protein
MKNVAHLCKVWGKDGWKKVVVCIISDGREEANEHTLELLHRVRPETSVLPCPHLMCLKDGLLH